VANATVGTIQDGEVRAGTSAAFAGAGASAGAVLTDGTDGADRSTDQVFARRSGRNRP